MNLGPNKRNLRFSHWRHIPVLTATVAILFCSQTAGKLGYDEMIRRALSECDKLEKYLCSPPVSSLNEDEINRRFMENPALASKSTARPTDMFHQAVAKIDSRDNLAASLQLIKRKRRANSGASQNYAELCSSEQEITEPFSFIKGLEGWEQVASTPRFPQRVTFQTEKCSRTNVPCRGVDPSSSDRFTPMCMQDYARHTILTFNQTTKNIEPRYITLPSACKCKLQLRRLVDEIDSQQWTDEYENSGPST